MASLPRTGETVMLRSLNAHSRIVVPFNTTDPNGSRQEEILYNFFKGHAPTEVDENNPVFKGLNLTSDSVLVVKQGIWTHDHPFNGFILLRNPASVYASLRTYGLKPGATREQMDQHWKGVRFPRLLAWLEAMGYKINDRFLKMPPSEQFCEFYSHRVDQLMKLDLPIIYYEDFVRSPEAHLRRICDAINVDYEPALMSSHEGFKENDIGHGFIKLNSPINEDSIYKYQKVLNRWEFEFIANNCELAGYSMEWDSVTTC